MGGVQRLGVDADNQPVPTAKGLVMHRLRLHNTANPLALIEDKAEVVWDRLMRTEQLSPEAAWEMLKRMGRVPRRKTFPGETELIEELSQLSKEYFFASLDHEAVPETVAAWARYGAASPERAPAAPRGTEPPRGCIEQDAERWKGCGYRIFGYAAGNRGNERADTGGTCLERERG